MSVLEVEITTTPTGLDVEMTAPVNALDVDIDSDGGVSFTGSSVKLSEVTLHAAAWVGSRSPYSQVVEIEGVTRNCLVDLQPSVAQLQIFHEKDLAFTTENNDGVVTVYAVGDKPTNDYTIQVTIMEVRA